MILHVARRRKIFLTQKGDSQPLVTVAVLKQKMNGEFILQIRCPDYMKCTSESRKKE